MKTINISEKLHKKLMKIKYEKEYKSLEQLIEELLDEHN